MKKRIVAHLTHGQIEQGKNEMEQENTLILKQYRVMVDMIGLFFKDSVEVVLHSLEDMERSVIYIHNGQKTSRKLGSPVTDKALRILEEFQRTKHTLFGPYKTVSREGHLMKSVTTVITNSSNQAIGLLCINFDLATPMHELFSILCADFESGRALGAEALAPTSGGSNSAVGAAGAGAVSAASGAALASSSSHNAEDDARAQTEQSESSVRVSCHSADSLTGESALCHELRSSAASLTSESLSDVSEHFATDIHDLLNTAVNKTRKQVLRDDSIPQRQKNKAIIHELNKQGLFNLRNAVPIISEILQLSKDAIYLHLRSCKR